MSRHGTTAKNQDCSKRTSPMNCLYRRPDLWRQQPEEITSEMPGLQHGGKISEGIGPRPDGQPNSKPAVAKSLKELHQGLSLIHI
eukprot:4172517-Heterocapsa_arctica.AAC.1